jgi:hypothetical protein
VTRPKYSENRVFPGGEAGFISAAEKHLQAVTNQIRYLLDQWNFSAEQRILGAVTTDYQPKFAGLALARLGRGAEAWLNLAADLLQEEWSAEALALLEERPIPAEPR